MTRTPLLSLLLSLAVAGCVSEPSRPPIGPAHAAPSRITHVQVRVETLGDAPNSGLLLPVISPDGKYVAALRIRGEMPLSPDVLFTGHGARGFALELRAASDGAPPRTVCSAGALWPTFSPDSRLLAFVRHDADGAARLAIYDITANTTRLLSAGGKGLAAPAVSPRGGHIAVIATSPADGQSRLLVLATATGKITHCPAAPGDRHYQPQWTPDGRVVFLLNRAGRMSLAHWKPGRFDPETLCPIDIGAAPLPAFQAFAGIDRPVSPNGKRLAYYHAADDRIALLDLTDGARTELPAGTRAGCWLNARTFVAATDEQMLLLRAGQASVKLLRGPWLPRAAVPARDDAPAHRTFLALTLGPHRRAFRLARLQLIPTP